MATKYENYITGDDSRQDIYGARWGAQMFTPSTNHIITSVKLLLYRNNSPSTVTVSIKATDANDQPTGSDLASGTTTGNNLATADPYTWREITFSSGALVVAGTIYAIVVRALTGDSGNNLYWRYDGSSAGYTGGEMDFSTDSGSTWGGTTSTSDCMFEEWGDPEGVGEGGGIFPSDAITRVTSLTHRYDRGTYTLELNLGEVVSDFGLPEWDSKPRGAVEPTFQERLETTARQLEDEANMSREESLRIARKLETLEEMERRERRVTPPKPSGVPTREEFWAAYPGVPYPYGEEKPKVTPPTLPPKPPVTPEEEAQIIKDIGPRLWNKIKGQQ